MTTALSLIEILSAGILWLLAAVLLGPLVGWWLAHGSGEWILDSWAEDEERAA